MHPEVVFRSATAADAAGVLEIYAPFIIDSAVSFELEVPSVEAMAERIGHYQETHPWLVAEVDGKVAAYAYGSTHRARWAYQWVAEVSVYVHPHFRRMGLARALYSALLYLLEQQGYRQVLAGIALPNAGSVAVHAAMGFEMIAKYPRVGFKLGQWWDTCWMHRSLGPQDDAPNELRMPDALEDAEWKKAWELARAAG